MERNYIVFTEIIDTNNNNIERWYYGIYDHNTANEVAMELGQDCEAGIYHCVIPLADAKKFDIKNMPK